MDFPQSVLAMTQQQLALMGRVGATRVYVTPPAPAALLSTSQPVPIRFTAQGFVLAMYGQESAQATLASYARTGVRVQVNGDEDLFVDGNGGPTYLGFLGAFGGVSNWYPLVRRVKQGDLWIFTFQNSDPANAITPQCSLAFFSDADVARMAQQSAEVRG